MKLLFICTHNRCRSILAEAITNHLADGSLIARSAGSQPAGEVHPLTLKYLAEAGISTDGLCSQSWNEHEGFAPDVVITVCDSAAGEQCPVWFGNSAKVHWGLPDPSRVTGTEAEVKAAFRNVMNTLEKRIKALLALQPDQIKPENIASTFNDIGKL